MEGPCEQQLIAALKESPPMLIPGKVKVYNVIQKLIPKSLMLSIQPETAVVLVFDVDVSQTVTLRKNIELLNRYCKKISIVFLPQVMNLEDELVRCTDVHKVMELTQSKGLRNFKTDFCKLKSKDCRVMLDRHRLNIDNLWMMKTPSVFAFVQNNGEQIKVKSCVK